MDSMDLNLSKLWKTVEEGESGLLQSMGSQRIRHNLAITVIFYVKSVDTNNIFCIGLSGGINVTKYNIVIVINFMIKSVYDYIICKILKQFSYYNIFKVSDT